jgi:hypothetical protein
VAWQAQNPQFSRAWTGIFGGSGGPGHGAGPLQIQAQAIALASDEAHNVLKAYGVWQQKTSYGRKFMGTVLIIPDQHIGPKSVQLLARARRARRSEVAVRGAAGCKSLTEAHKITVKSPFRFPNC